jgi:hypothetical protein
MTETYFKKRENMQTTLQSRSASAEPAPRVSVEVPLTATVQPVSTGKSKLVTAKHLEDHKNEMKATMSMLQTAVLSMTKTNEIQKDLDTHKAEATSKLSELEIRLKAIEEILPE